MKEQDFISAINTNNGIINKICRLYCEDKDDRLDLYQEIVAQLWKARHKFRGESKVSTWIYRVSLNLAISDLKKKKRKPERNHATMPDTSIKEYLENMLEWISNFSVLYFRLNLVLMPFAILLAIIVALNVKNGVDIFQSGFLEEFSPLLVIAVLIIYTAVILLLSYPILKWYTRKMFGNHINSLRNSLNELRDYND